MSSTIVPSRPVVRIREPPVVVGLRRALLIGINYVNSKYQLAGCINDVTSMTDHLKRFYPGCREITTLTDNTSLKPTRENIIRGIDWLVRGIRPGEHVFFHYSGHGGLVRDRNGDEVTGFDSCIYPFDGKNMEQISDDELRTLLVNRIPAGCKCFIIIDACHSGSAVDLRCRLQTPTPNSLLFEELPQYPKTQGEVVLLSGCHDLQVAADTVNTDRIPCGALTWALIETWKKYGTNIKLKHLLWDVLTFLRQRKYTQIPQLTLGHYTDFDTVFNLTTR
jgi:hypothetical protein